MLRRKFEQGKPTMQIAPMIDCVFLLLVYFMVGSTMEKQEADIGFQLPGTVAMDEPFDLPDEQIIEITADGRAVINDYAYELSPGRLSALTAMLARFRQSCESNRVEAAVTLAPAPQASHQAIVRVMDACAAAGIGSVQFALGEEAE